MHDLHHVRPKRGTEISKRKGRLDSNDARANGTERALSAEQLLSHILPRLAGGGQFTVKVKSNMINRWPVDDVKTHVFEDHAS